DNSSDMDFSGEFCFAGKTDEEISFVCETERVPENTIEREDGWRAFRIEGVLDFSLIGILAKIAGLLADSGISIFAVSTYNTDYIMIKEEKWEKALSVLKKSGYEVL
ncbi:MAG: ACT domain-containing protein, partial [Firmicutes bacterium]|nr:ACT domain-containing protein [Bacillota bacterium]